MLLQIMPLAHDIRLNGVPIRHLHPRDLTLGRVRLLGFHLVNARDDALLLGVALKQRRCGPFGAFLMLAPDSLVECHKCGRCGVKEAGGREGERKDGGGAGLRR